MTLWTKLALGLLVVELIAAMAFVLGCYLINH